MTDSNIVAGLRTDAALFGKMPPHAKVNMNPEFMREMSQLWIAAADEIERLRAERDEARRSVCEMSIQLGGVYRRVGGKTVEVTTPEGCAEIMRWDCFGKETNV